ncbi:TIR-like protein FxsC [Plantactinospora solaniradicis]|uniref:TIR-like protein FxsC n=1 Tax=Plantactinospora solaniradicis TaxID=1723736 RepID=A0ABW1KCH2_9ACTN
MSWADRVPGSAGARPDTYFFLSYAHSVPLSAAAKPDTDYWVTKFFNDLRDAVRAGVTRTGETDIGFFDGLVTPGADLKQVLTEALSVAHVFVPLYSPNYFSNTWALGERASFWSRLAKLRRSEADRHVLPVLWIPLPPWDDRPETTEALELVGDDTEYAENGLRAFCMLRFYQRQYARIVETLAKRIIAVTEGEPLPRSAATAVSDSPTTDGDDTALLVTVLAPDGRANWRPYPVHELAVADHVAATAARLGLPTRVVEFGLARDQAPDSPAIVLINSDLGEAAVRAAIDGLPRWVVPLVIAADPGATAEVIADTLRNAGFPPVRPVREADEFERTAPQLVIEARRQFLRHGPVNPPAGPARSRPSLRPGETFNVRQPQEEDL